MKITRITFPEGNKIAEAIAISANFNAYAYNLKKELAYIKQYPEWTESAKRQLASFKAMSLNYPEYSNHPNYIKAKALADKIESLI